MLRVLVMLPASRQDLRFGKFNFLVQFEIDGLIEGLKEEDERSGGTVMVDCGIWMLDYGAGGWVGGDRCWGLEMRGVFRIWG